MGCSGVSQATGPRTSVTGKITVMGRVWEAIRPRIPGPGGSRAWTEKPAAGMAQAGSQVCPPSGE